MSGGRVYQGKVPRWLAPAWPAPTEWEAAQAHCRKRGREERELNLGGLGTRTPQARALRARRRGMLLRAHTQKDSG